jgi:acyl carrier protein
VTNRRRDVEHSVREVWRDLLGVDKAQEGDNFFDLGGDSMLAMVAVASLEKTLAIKLSIGDLYAHPTLGRLLERLMSASGRECDA